MAEMMAIRIVRRQLAGLTKPTEHHPRPRSLSEIQPNRKIKGVSLTEGHQEVKQAEGDNDAG